MYHPYATHSHQIFTKTVSCERSEDIRCARATLDSRNSTDMGRRVGPDRMEAEDSGLEEAGE
jgi:hypothetical protein